MTPAELIAEYLKLDDWVEAESKRFDSHMKPHRETLEAFKTQLLDLMNKEGVKSYKSDAGTAYQSTIVSPMIDGDKTAFLDWVLEDWEGRGAMLQIGAPQKAAFQDYFEANNGQMPPMVKTTSITRVNIRRS